MVGPPKVQKPTTPDPENNLIISEDAFSLLFRITINLFNYDFIFTLRILYMNTI